MNYTKLKISFLVLLAMTIIQLLVGLFIIHNTLITVLSAIAIILCICGLTYVSKHAK